MVLSCFPQALEWTEVFKNLLEKYLRGLKNNLRKLDLTLLECKDQGFIFTTSFINKEISTIAAASLGEVGGREEEQLER